MIFDILGILSILITLNNISAQVEIPLYVFKIRNISMYFLLNKDFSFGNKSSGFPVI